MNRWFDLVSIRTAAMAMNKFHPEKIIEVKYFLMQVLDLIIFKFKWQSSNHHFSLICIDIILHSPLQGDVAATNPLPLQRDVTAAASPLPLQRDVAAANPPPQQILCNR